MVYLANTEVRKLALESKMVVCLPHFLFEQSSKHVYRFTRLNMWAPKEKGRK